MAFHDGLSMHYLQAWGPVSYLSLSMAITAVFMGPGKVGIAVFTTGTLFSSSARASTQSPRRHFSAKINLFGYILLEKKPNAHRETALDVPLSCRKLDRNGAWRTLS